MDSREYLPELERARAAREKSLQDIKDESLDRLERDLAVDKRRDPALNEAWDDDYEEYSKDGDDANEDGEDIVDRCECLSLIQKPIALVHGVLLQPEALGGESTSTSLDKRGTGTTRTGLDQPD